MMYSANDIEGALLDGLAQIRSGKTGTGSRGLCWFAEQEQGHPEVPEAFACAISVGSALWGAPIQVGLGPAYGEGDVERVPSSLWESRTLEYAWWVTAEFVVSVTVDTHDADSLRTLNLHVGHAREP
jgi:hypothetical protein